MFMSSFNNKVRRLEANMCKVFILNLYERRKICKRSLRKKYITILFKLKIDGIKLIFAKSNKETKRRLRKLQKNHE